MISYKDVDNILVVNNAKSKLLLIDFDLTITSKHIHNILSKSNEENRDEQWNLVKHILPRGSAKDWAFIIKTAIANGYGVGIVSFNDYEHIVKRYIKDVIFKRKNLHFLEHIYIKCELPKDYDPNTSNKNAYIQEAKIFFNFQGNNKDIIFVDDSPKNIGAAEKEGYQTILADKSDHNGAFICILMAKVHTSNDNPTLIGEVTDNDLKDSAADTMSKAKNEEKSRVNQESDVITFKPILPIQQVYKIQMTKMASQIRKHANEEKSLLLPGEENTSVSIMRKNTSYRPAFFSTGMIQIDGSASEEINASIRDRRELRFSKFESIIASVPSTTITINILHNILEVVFQQSWAISVDNFFICSRPYTAEEVYKKRFILINFFNELGIEVTERMNTGKTIDIVGVDGTESFIYFIPIDSLASAKKIRINASWFQGLIGIHELKTIIDIFKKMRVSGYDREKVLVQLKEIYNHANKESKNGCTVLAQAGRASDREKDSKYREGITSLPHELLIHVAYLASGSLFSKKEVEKKYNYYLNIKHKI